MDNTEKLQTFRLYCADEFTVIVELENKKFAFTPCIENNVVVMKQIIKNEKIFNDNKIIEELNVDEFENDGEYYLEDTVAKQEELPVIAYEAEFLEEDEFKRLEEEFISQIIEEQQFTDDDNLSYEALESDKNTEIITNLDPPIEKEQYIFRKKSLNDKTLKGGALTLGTRHQNYFQNGDGGLGRVSNKQLKIDIRTMISAKEFKRQLNDTSDLQRINITDYSKSNKLQNKYDNWLPKLFSSPMLKYTESKLLNLYQRNCISTFNEIDEDILLMPLSHQEIQIIHKNNNKRKKLNIKRNQNLFNDIYTGDDDHSKISKFDNFINVETEQFKIQDDDDGGTRFIYIKNKKYEIINYS